MESKAPTGHGTKLKAVHAGLVATALEVQRQPEAMATPQHQFLLAQVVRVVVTAIGLNLQITPLQDQLCRDRNRGRNKLLWPQVIQSARYTPVTFSRLW